MPMGSMGVNGGEWDQWGPMDINGTQWKPMGIKGHTGLLGGHLGVPWGSIGASLPRPPPKAHHDGGQLHEAPPTSPRRPRPHPQAPPTTTPYADHAPP